ncbi:type IX secretion system membrane protein PorP/SprF [Olleya sp. AH-315-K02]|nr:type IX secretion system membrane protein PorP/SprF [Olleya sp. AH-315-K02]
MRIDKKIQYLKIVFLFPVIVMSQQFPQFSQYMFNTIAINPAYAGTREELTIAFLNRNQWVGINGAPVTQTLTLDSSFPNTKLGAGLSIINDKLGYENTTSIYADVSYTLDVNYKYILSFGIKAGISKYGLDAELLIDPDAIGDQYLGRIFNNWKPNFGVGIYLRSEDLFLGLSSPRLFDYNNNTSIEYVAIERASYYLNGGYMLEFNHQVSFKPTFLIKYTNGAPISIDLTANLLIEEKLWVGAAYRLNDALGGYVSLQITDDIKFGYAYEFITSAISTYTSGSHELFMSYQIKLFEPDCDCENKF